MERDKILKAQLLKPKITIILATYNRAHLIGETLLSIQNQTQSNFECLIIDDGSTDETNEIIKPFLDDERFNYFKRMDNYKKGLSGSRNYGLDLSNGNYISFCDDDDLMHPQNLEACLYYLVNDAWDFCHFKKQTFVAPPEFMPITDFDGYEKDRLGLGQLPEILGNQIGLASCTVMWKSAAIGNLRFNESLPYAEELELYSRLIMQPLKGLIIDLVLYFNRKHPRSNTAQYHSGDTAMIDSLVKSYALIMDALSKKKLFTSSYARLFAWKAALLNEKSLLDHVLKTSGKNTFQGLQAQLIYYMHPLWKWALRVKKKLRHA